LFLGYKDRDGKAVTCGIYIVEILSEIEFWELMELGKGY
jgi:hypothetical protein